MKTLPAEFFLRRKTSAEKFFCAGFVLQYNEAGKTLSSVFKVEIIDIDSVALVNAQLLKPVVNARFAE